MIFEVFLDFKCVFTFFRLFILISVWDIPRAPFSFPDHMLLGALEALFGLCWPSHFCIHPNSSDI